MPRSTVFIILLIAFLLPASSLRAGHLVLPVDGQSASVRMPTQEAAIFFGTETKHERLLTRPTVEFERPGEFLWLFPVPAGLDDFETGGSGAETLQGLDQTIRRRVVTHIGGTRGDPLLLLPWVIIIVLLVLMAQFWKRLGKAGRGGAVALAALMVLGSYLLEPGDVGRAQTQDPSLVSTQASPPSLNLDEIELIEPETREALIDWLSSKGAEWPGEKADIGTKIYFEQGWKYLAAKLHVPAAGRYLLETLSVSFGTDGPLYPLRLTALADNREPEVTLFIVGPTTYHRPPLKMQFADQFLIDATGQVSAYKSELILPAGVQLWDAGKEQSWITRIEGRVKKRKLLTADALPRAKEKPVAYQGNTYTPQAAGRLAVLVAMWLILIGTPAAAAAVMLVRLPWWLAHLLALGFAAITAWIFYLNMPIIGL